MKLSAVLVLVAALLILSMSSAAEANPPELIRVERGIGPAGVTDLVARSQLWLAEVRLGGPEYGNVGRGKIYATSWTGYLSNAAVLELVKEPQWFKVQIRGQSGSRSPKIYVVPSGPKAGTSAPSELYVSADHVGYICIPDDRSTIKLHFDSPTFHLVVAIVDPAEMQRFLAWLQIELPSDQKSADATVRATCTD